MTEPRLDFWYDPLAVTEDVCVFGRSPRCEVCRQVATFISPRPYCDEHWCAWWGAEDPSGRMYREAKFDLLANRLPRWTAWLCWRAFDLMELLLGWRGRG